MKKSVLLFVGLLLTAVSAIAQPAKPTVTYSDWVEETDVYLYNVEASMFLVGSNNWGTRAALVGGGSNSNIITYDKFLGGNGTIKGTKWQILQMEDKRGQAACFELSNTEISGRGLIPSGANECWVDGGPAHNDASLRDIDGWYIVKTNADKTFQLNFTRKAAKKDEEGNEVKEGDQVVYEYTPAPGVLCANKFTDGELNINIAESATYSTWAIVTVDEYDRVVPLLNLYWAGQGLKKLLDDADGLGLDADLAEYKALLTKADVTLEELQNAIKKVSPAINFGKVIADAKKADPARDWSKYEAIYADPASTDEIFTTNTNYINVLLALKKALDDAKDLDGAKKYDHAEALYGDDEAAQADIEAETQRVNAYISLKKALDAAQAEYATLNFSEPTAVYDNPEATVEDMAAAELKIKEIINADNLSKATLDNPADITDAVGYLVDLNAISAGNGSVPKAGWTSTKTSGNFHINTWSVEGNAGNDGTNMTTPFIEYWKSKGNVLDNQKFFRDPEKWPFTAPAGAYRISANIRLYNESGAKFMKGAYIFGNNNRTSLTVEGVETDADGNAINAIEGATYGSYNNMLLYWKDSFETYAIVPDGGTLTFGVQTQDVNFNWVASKGWKVEYLGDSYEALDYARKNSSLSISVDADTYGTKSVIEEYQATLADYTTGTDAAKIKASYAKLGELAEAVQASIDAYKAYADKVDELKKGIDDGTIDLSGPDADILYDYLDELGEELGPDSEPAIELGFKNGYSAYILANCELNTEEITAELEFLNMLYETAMRTSIKDGSDLTELLVNPDFSTNDWTGWTKVAASGGNVAVAEKCAEAWNNASFDIYQEQDDLPDGLYEISVQGFYRYKRGNPAFQIYKEQSSDYVKEGGSPCYVYMNTMITPFTNVFAEENKGQEFYGSTNYDTYTYGEGDDAITEYFPNGMSSAAVAFDAGMYTQTAYGLVLDGEKMRIGVKGSSNQDGDSWVIFDNFKLTYRAKNPEVAQKVLTLKAEALKELIDNSGDLMTDPAQDAANYALSEAQKTDLNDAAKYEVLIETNAAYNAAKENIQAVETYKAAKTAYDTAVDELKQVDEDEEDAIWNDIDEMDDELQGDAYSYLTTEEVTELTAKVEKLTEEVKAATTAVQNKDIYEEMVKATDENPYDATDLIINPSYDAGNDDGWSYDGNGPGRGNRSDMCEYYKASFNYYQTLVALPAGTYEVSVQCYARYNDDQNADLAALENNTKSNLLKAHVYAKVGEGSFAEQFRLVSEGAVTDDFYSSSQREATSSIQKDENGEFVKLYTPNNMSMAGKAFDAANQADKDVADDVEGAVAWSDAQAYRVRVVFTLEETSNVTIGVKDESSSDWCIWDNWKLTYFGNASAKENSGTNIESVDAIKPADGKYFLNGQIVIVKNGVKYNIAGQIIK
jgi:hypothetical protein